MRIRRLAAPLALAALSLAAWVHILYVDPPEQYGIPSFDLVNYFYPTVVFLHQELRDGNFPLWNPYQLAGEPFVALQVPGHMYPPGVALVAMLRPARALEAHGVLHLFLAGWLTWLFAGRIGLGPAGRLVAAAGYMLSGPMLFASIYVPFYVSTEVWLPGLLLAIHGLAREASARWSVLLAVFVAVAFLGGHVQGWVYSVQFAAAYGLFALVALAEPGTRLRVSALALLAGVLAAGLVAPQLLPSLELAGASVRSLAGLSFHQVTFGQAEASDLLRGLVGLPPDLGFAAVVGPRLWLLALPALSVPLFALGWLARDQRAQWTFALAAAAIAGLLMLGAATPLFGLYFELPAGDWFRIPTRMAFVYSFFASIAIGIGVEGARAGLSRMRISGRVAAVCVAGLAALPIADLFLRVELTSAHPVLKGESRGAPDSVLSFLERQPGRWRFFVEQRRLSLRGPAFRHKAGMMNRLFAVPDYEPSVPADYAQFLKGRRAALWHAGESVLSDMRTRPAPALAKLLDLMSVRFYVALDTLPAEALLEIEDFVRGEHHDLGDAHVFERHSALPRVYAVREVVLEPDVASAIDRATRDRFQPKDVAIVVDAKMDRSRFAGLQDHRHRPASQRDSARILRYETETVEIEAECAEPCLLVATDLFYPGWRVAVDDEEDEIHRVNGLFRGVLLNPGRHRVVYRYQPSTFRVGIVLCVVSLAGAAAVVAVGPLRARMHERRRERVS